PGRGRHRQHRRIRRGESLPLRFAGDVLDGIPGAWPLRGPRAFFFPALPPSRVDRVMTEPTAPGLGTAPLPSVVESEEQLEGLLSRPSPADVELLKSLRGDVAILGAGGKMGPSLARLIRRAADAAGRRRRVAAVSRFSDSAAARALEAMGID